MELLKMFFCIICNCLKRCKHLEVGGGRGGVGMGKWPAQELAQSGNTDTGHMGTCREFVLLHN